MARFITAGLAAALALGIFLAPASAHVGPCASREEFAAGLKKAYAEAPVQRVLDRGGRLIEVFSTPGGETWTITVTIPGGVTCGVASGAAWETIEPAAGDEASR